ncbi:hypothetical protein [[Actinomadura] parvosata]|uniref:hypothetical protein n=1 Tax=[Actinomadura] parvosata TaxID=1955412 RepID=UPI0012BC56AE|nr:hypothetical protein [Nonomuraea sp. ATCC 55076]
MKAMLFFIAGAPLYFAIGGFGVVILLIGCTAESWIDNPWTLAAVAAGMIVVGALVFVLARITHLSSKRTFSGIHGFTAVVIDMLVTFVSIAFIGATGGGIMSALALFAMGQVYYGFGFLAITAAGFLVARALEDALP